MKPPPYLLPWVRVLLLIRSITFDHLGPRGMAAGEAATSPGIGDAPEDRAGGLVGLAPVR
jgi:hypothetical protein